MMTPGQFGPITRVRRRIDRHHFEHVVDRDAFGDADDEFDAGVGSFEDRVRGERRRHEDDADVRAGFFARFADAVENRETLDGLAALAGRDAADDVSCRTRACGWRGKALLAR